MYLLLLPHSAHLQVVVRAFGQALAQAEAKAAQSKHSIWIAHFNLSVTVLPRPLKVFYVTTYPFLQNYSIYYISRLHLSTLTDLCCGCSELPRVFHASSFDSLISTIIYISSSSLNSNRPLLWMLCTSTRLPRVFLWRPFTRCHTRRCKRWQESGRRRV